jgi:hypothetical protein
VLREPDDRTIRLVAEGLVQLAGTDAAAVELERLYGRDRAMEALCRTATAGNAMSLQDDLEVILDLTDHRPVIDLRHDVPAPDRPTGHVPPPSSAAEIDVLALRDGIDIALRGRRVPAVAGRPYWL